MKKERRVGTISRGIRCPIIREGDNLAAIVADSVLEAAEKAAAEDATTKANSALDSALAAFVGSGNVRDHTIISGGKISSGLIDVDAIKTSLGAQTIDLNNKAHLDAVIKAMNDLREVVDEAESKVDKKDWPMPTYVDLLYEI